MESLLFFSRCSNRDVVRIDSRLHCTDIANPLKLGGQQWRRREKRKLRRSRRRRRLARRSSRRLSLVFDLLNESETEVTRTGRCRGGRNDRSGLAGSGALQGASAGRRRKLHTRSTLRDGEDETRQSPISLRHSAGRLNPSTISPTPSDIVLRFLLAPWTRSMAPFLLAAGYR